MAATTCRQHHAYREGRKYTVLVGEGRDEGTVKRDPAKTPKTMDITGTKGPNEGKTFLAIYESKGDELRVCYDLSGANRDRLILRPSRRPSFLGEIQAARSRERPDDRGKGASKFLRAVTGAIGPRVL